MSVIKLPKKCCARCRYRTYRLIDAYWCTEKNDYSRMESVCSRFKAGKSAKKKRRV